MAHLALMRDDGVQLEVVMRDVETYSWPTEGKAREALDKNIAAAIKRQKKFDLERK